MEYPYVIVVNGKPETLFSSQDFEYLLEKSMGHDAVEYFRSVTDGLAEENQELAREIERLIVNHTAQNSEYEALEQDHKTLRRKLETLQCEYSDLRRTTKNVIQKLEEAL